jgi:hypothetical protein
MPEDFKPYWLLKLINFAGLSSQTLLLRTFCLDTKSIQKVKAEKCSLSHPTAPPLFGRANALGVLF